MYKAIHSLVLITAVAATTTTQNYRGYFQYHEEKNVPITKRGGQRKDYYTVLLKEIFGTLGVTNPSSDFIKFEGPTSRDGEQVPEPQITDECRRMGYCLTVENYPVSLVERLIDEYPDKGLFRMDEPDDEDVQVVQRLGTDTTEPTLNLCSASTETKSPQAGQDKNNTWYNIINTPNKQVQTFTSEICSNPGQTCSYVDAIPGYVTECYQKHVYRTAAVLGENKQIVFKELRFPSCCSCRLKQI